MNSGLKIEEKKKIKEIQVNKYNFVNRNKDWKETKVISWMMTMEKNVISLNSLKHFNTLSRMRDYSKLPTQREATQRRDSEKNNIMK